MELIIDIQPIFDKEYKIIPKEVAVMSLQGDAYSHWIIKPPHEFSQLNSYLQRANNSLTKFVHDIEWFEGDTTLKHVQENLKAFMKSASHIYVSGRPKVDFLTDILGRKVINLDGYEVPSFAMMNSKYKDEILTSCVYHKTKSCFWVNCAVHKAALLKKWLNDLKIKFRDSITKEVKENNKPRTLNFDKDEDEGEILEILEIYACEYRKNNPVCDDSDEENNSTSSSSTILSTLSNYLAKDPEENKENEPSNIKDKEEDSQNNTTAGLSPIKESPSKKDEYMSNITGDSTPSNTNSRGSTSRSNPANIDETDSISN